VLGHWVIKLLVIRSFIESLGHFFRDLTISPFHHSTIPPFHHSTIPPYHHITISPFHHIAISPFHHIAILPLNHIKSLLNSTKKDFYHYFSPFLSKNLLIKAFLNQIIMALTQDEQKMIRDSWGKVITHTEEAGLVFYQYLFSFHPELKPLFPTDLKAQARKLIAAVTILVTKMDKSDHIREEVHKLAQRHIHYGVKPVYFAMFGEAFLITLAQVLASIWSEPLKMAWQSAYTMISEAMIEEMKTED
jgi:hemoglobin-like flavoprotein